MTTVYMLDSQSKGQMMSFILKSEDHLVIIDGGNMCDGDYLCTYTKSLGGVVDGWFFTHPHSDHCNAFSSLMQRRAHEIDLKGVYYNFPSKAFMGLADDEQGRDALETTERMETEINRHGVPVTTIHRGDVFEFGEMKLTVLHEPDENITDDRINNSSVVLRLDANGKSMIFLGDLGVKGGEQLLEQTSPALLKADMVQLAHHGENGVARPIYDAIDADFCFWCTPKWLWDNDAGYGYDTHTWKTVVTRGWMSEIGVKWHYISKDGTHEVPFDDLDPTVHMVRIEYQKRSVIHYAEYEEEF